MRGSCKRLWLVGVAGLLLAEAGCVMPESLSLSSLTTTETTPAPKENGLPAAQAAQLSMDYAVSLDQKRNFRDAADQYEKVLQLDPNNKQALRRAAFLNDKLAQFAKAERFYEKLAKLTPKDANLHSNWGYSCYQRGTKADSVEAEKHIRRALELKPDFDKAHCNLGMVLGQQDKYKEAFQEFKAAKLTDADAHCDVGFIYCCKGRFEEARREYTLARTLDPSCAKAQEMLNQLDQPSRRLQATTLARTQTMANAQLNYLPTGSMPQALTPLPSTQAAVSQQPAAPGTPVLHAGGTDWIQVDYRTAKPATDVKAADPMASRVP